MVARQAVKDSLRSLNEQFEIVQPGVDFINSTAEATFVGEARRDVSYEE